MTQSQGGLQVLRDGEFPGGLQRSDRQVASEYMRMGRKGIEMSKGTFQKIEKTEDRMYGPWKLIACGYKADEQQIFLNFLKKLGFEDLPVIFVFDEQKNFTLEELLRQPHETGLGTDSSLTRAVILSGFSQEGIHRILSGYRSYGFPKQLWATLTPISIKWTISALLNELEKEARAFEKRKRSESGTS